MPVKEASHSTCEIMLRHFENVVENSFPIYRIVDRKREEDKKGRKMRKGNINSFWVTSAVGGKLYGLVFRRSERFLFSCRADGII